MQKIMLFIKKMGCEKKEYKNIEIGGKEYKGVGFNIRL